MRLILLRNLRSLVVMRLASVMRCNHKTSEWPQSHFKGLKVAFCHVLHFFFTGVSNFLYNFSAHYFALLLERLDHLPPIKCPYALLDSRFVCT